MKLGNTGVGTVMVSPGRISWRPIYMASKLNSEQLRSQLDEFHSEAEITRAKANSARLRLLRLSEAAEKLKRQAAINVQSGRENDARELLFQKKKVMEALQKSKSRIELLDELSTKLNEVISVKERQLIGNVSVDLEVAREDTSSPVRIVSPTTEITGDINYNDMKSNDDQELQFHEDFQIHQEDDSRGSMSGVIHNDDKIISNLKGVSTYEGFLENMDQQLSEIEAELVTIIRVSNLILDGVEKTNHFKVQQAMELLESIRGTRERITNIKLAEVEST